MMVHDGGSKIQDLEERLIAFEEAFPSADAHVRDLLLRIRNAVIRTKEALDHIHIASLPHPTGIQPVCFDCGQTELDVIYTSKRDRCQLCAPCFHRREKRGAARADTRPLEASAVPLSQAQ